MDVLQTAGMAELIFLLHIGLRAATYAAKPVLIESPQQHQPI